VSFSLKGMSHWSTCFSYSSTRDPLCIWYSMCYIFLLYVQLKSIAMFQHSRPSIIEFRAKIEKAEGTTLCSLNVKESTATVKLVGVLIDRKITLNSAFKLTVNNNIWKRLAGWKLVTISFLCGGGTVHLTAALLA